MQGRIQAREKKTSKLVAWQTLSHSHQVRIDHLNEDHGRGVEKKSPRKQEPEVLRLDNKIVPGCEEKSESRISFLFLDQTPEWEAVPHNKERNGRGFPC